MGGAADSVLRPGPDLLFYVSIVIHTFKIHSYFMIFLPLVKRGGKKTEESEVILHKLKKKKKEPLLFSLTRNGRTHTHKKS